MQECKSMRSPNNLLLSSSFGIYNTNRNILCLQIFVEAMHVWALGRWSLRLCWSNVLAWIPFPILCPAPKYQWLHTRFFYYRESLTRVAAAFSPWWWNTNGKRRKKKNKQSKSNNQHKNRHIQRLNKNIQRKKSNFFREHKPPTRRSHP